jgi:hypothetical protein
MISPAEKKAALLNASNTVKMGIHELGQLLRTSTPMAGQLLVTKDIEKLQRQLERVQMGLQELVL